MFNAICLENYMCNRAITTQMSSTKYYQIVLYFSPRLWNAPCMITMVDMIG